MRRFALGKLKYTPDQYGLMLVGDFLDAMAGYNEARFEHKKDIAGIIREATTILWNIQVQPENRLDPEELWPFVWEKSRVEAETPQSEEERKRAEDAQAELLNKQFP